MGTCSLGTRLSLGTCSERAWSPAVLLSDRGLWSLGNRLVSLWGRVTVRLVSLSGRLRQMLTNLSVNQ